MRSASRTFFRKLTAGYLPACLFAIALSSASATVMASTVAPALYLSHGLDISSPLQQDSSQQRIPGQTAKKQGALEGAVRDGGKKPVIAANVILRNIETGQERKKSSDAEGVFRFIDLLPGQYQLKIDAQGYESFREDGIRVDAGGVLIREITLVSIPPAAAPPANLPELPPRASPSSAEAGQTPPSGYSEMKQNTGLETSAATPAPEPPSSSGPVFSAEPDRWLLTMPDWNRYGTGGEHPYVKGKFWDPFDTNKLKGDKPVFGQQTFFNFTAISDTFVDGRRLPTPTGASTALPGTTGFFGNGNQAFVDQVFLFSFDLFHGDTSFRPVDWRIRITPAISLNYLDVQERGVVNVNVNKGTTRLDSHIGLQEAFAEVKLHDLSPNFDFVSVRAGIQGFNSDFRGFLFVEEQPGIRIFGNLESNRWQYNVAYFNFLEKNTNSELNSMKLRNQQVIIANVYRQDFFFQGYTAQFSVHYNKDDATLHFDDNGFLVRPAPIGAVFSQGILHPHSIHAAYVGWTGDGHIGTINLTHAFYQAFGNDSFNGIAGRAVTINAQMAALELSIDKDWIRFKTSAFYSSGSAHPQSSRARGFDSIDDFPEFAGGMFSLWNRESIRLTGTGVALNSGNSLLPDLRSNKDEGQANFVNPGIFLANVGADFDVTPKLRGFVNVNYLRFERTEPLELILFQSPIHHSIGEDASVGIRYRPPLSENISLTAGAAVLVPGQGLRDIYTGRTLFSVFTDLRFQF